MILGHKKQWDFLLKMARERKIPHALLFVGQEGIGKKKIALEFAKILFGQDPFSHPDFIFVEPIDNLISIGQIRDLIWRLSLKPFSFDFKIAIVDDAHLMPPDAQNCFLKKLEEPENSVIILITPHPDLLFPTILSRCQKIKFYPAPKEEIKKFLIENGLNEEKAEKIAKISGGKIGEAISFLNHQKYMEREEKIKDFKKILQSPLYLRFNYVKELVEKNETKETLKIWLYFLREKLIEAIKNKDLEIRKLISSILILEKIYYLVLTKNINKRLALEILMLEL
jgi:DNA polymerase-3 subunit delta'